MHTLGDMAKKLNRPAVYLHGLQERFALPVLEGAGYSHAYLAWLRTVVFLRLFGVAEETLLKLWHLELKLLQLLHLDGGGSPTWFLDACGLSTHPERRLLLTNQDIGGVIPASTIQPGLSFEPKDPKELFSGPEMGEDALRVLKQYVALFTRVRTDLAAELPQVREAAKWAARLP